MIVSRLPLRLVAASLAAPALAAFAAVVGVTPVDAQDFVPWYSGSPYSSREFRPRHTARAERNDDEDRDAKSKRREAGVKDGTDKVAKTAAGPLFGVISLSDQRISIYNSDGLVAKSIISTGMTGHRTPTGIFTIIGRERYHSSNIYSGAPMPYMQRLTWSGVAIHLGVVPGYPASHGCVRLPSGFAQQLWGMTKIGERVVVSPHEVAPAEFSHALLPTPKFQPAPLVASDDTQAVTTDAAAPAPVGLTQVATTNSTIAVPLTPTPPAPRLLNPIEYAQALGAKATADARAAAKVVKDAVATASAKSADARKAVVDSRMAESARVKAENKVVAAAKSLDAASTPEAKANAEAAKAAAEADLQEAAKKAEEASAAEAAKRAEALDAQRAWREATASVEAAEQAGKEAKRRASPVSVLISKKDKRVYVRQGLRPLLDAPAVFRDPEIPLGTHVYIAAAAQQDGTSLRWTVVSMPSPAAGPAVTVGRGNKKASREEKVSPAPKAATPAEALERVELPKEVIEQIAQLLWLGGSLIITDQPLSSETSDVGTDLVVTMRY
jgi:hypothetical protein